MDPFLYDFSVIIPTRNRPGLLRECVAALDRGDYPRDRYEIVVVDGSDESATADLTDFAGRVNLRSVRQEQHGPAAARNLGAGHARGRFIAFTDDDTVPGPGWLRALSVHLFASPDELIGGRLLNGLVTNPYATTHHLIIDAAYEFFDPAKGRAHFFATSNMAVAAEKFRELNGFEDWSLCAAEDRALCFRWLERGWPMRYVPEAVVSHRHDLTLLSFMELFFRYGRGAYRYAALRASTGNVRLKPEWHFYRLCFRRAFSRPEPVSPLILVVLLCFWQVLNAGGYFAELIRDRWGKRAGLRVAPADIVSNTNNNADGAAQVVKKPPAN